VGAPDTWISGTDGARAGIYMPARPATGTPSFSQGLAPSVGFADRGQVAEMGRTTPTPFRVYDDVMVVDEWSTEAPEDGHQLKYYAPGVGNIYVTPKGGDSLESLSLVSVARLSPQELADVHNQTLAMDAEAYKVAKAYGATSRAGR
jgi:hypothetical protein